MADMFADRQLKDVIRRITDNPKQYILDNKEGWFNLTKCMLRNFPAMEVFGLIEQAVCEVSDEQWFEHKYPKEIFEEKFVKNVGNKKYKRKDFKEYSLLHPEIEKIVSRVSIVELADRYDLRPLGKLKRICPFHPDSDPSLSLNDKKGLFKCFGCNASGGIIKFNALLKKYMGDKNGNNNK